jgi:hypothetical protein
MISHGMLFWILMILWAIFGFAWNTNPGIMGGWGAWGNWLLLFVLFGLLGWKVFGPAIGN